MQFTKNKRFFVKELSGGDHKEFIQLSKSYVEYINRKPESLLIRFYYHFRRTKDSKVDRTFLRLLIGRS